MIKRILSSFFIFAIFFIFTFYVDNNVYFIILAIFIYGVMLYEWFVMVKKKFSQDLYIGFTVIFCSLISFIYLFLYDLTGILIFNYLCVIWTVDIMALISGKIFKNTPKLAPIISPNKTWSGFFIGSICTTLTLYILHTYFGLSLTNVLNLKFDFKILYQMIFVVFLGMIAQLSDLFVSFFKRKFSIKDTGKLIPGHGGFLDRFDSFLFTSPLISTLLLIIA